MTSTALAAPDPQEPGKYLALNHDVEELREIIADNLDGEEMTARDLVRLKVPSGGGTAWEMTTLDGTEYVKTITGVIVHKVKTRAWWPASIDEGGGGKPPSCSSPDAKVGYGKRSATKDDPDPAGEEPSLLPCKQCPHSQFGSGKNGGQACKEKAQWFVLLEGSFLPIVLTLPAMSLQPAKEYLSLLSSAGLPFRAVVTRFTLEKRSNGGNDYAVVKPERVGNLNAEEAAKVREYGQLLRGLFDQVAAEANTEPAGATVAS